LSLIDCQSIILPWTELQDKEAQGKRWTDAAAAINKYGTAALDILTPVFSIMSSQAEKNIQETQAQGDERMAQLGS